MIPLRAVGSPLVLNVDDDDVTRYAISQILVRGGYRVMEAVTGTDALAKVASERPALVILDINLPDASGIDVCRRLKATPGTALVPVLQVSASRVAIEDQVAGLEGGADAYLTWPVDQHVLLATARSLLRAREAEAAAARIGRQWQVTVDAARDAIGVVDEGGRIVRANRRLGDLTGVPPAELAGLHLPTLLDPDGESGLESRIAQVLAGTAQDPVEVRLGATWQRISLDRLEDDDREGLGVVLVLTDVTEERLRLEGERQARMTLAAIVGQMPVGLLVADREGLVVVRNGQLEALVGRPIEGVSLLDDRAWEDTSYRGATVTAATSPMVRALHHGERFDDDELEVRAGDATRTLRFSAAPVEIDGEVTAVVATFSDITERKALDAIRDTFIGVLSHELRTPVTTILAGSRLLDKHRATLDAEVSAGIVQDIAAEAERLHRLVEDLLVLARTERGVAMQVADPVLLQHVIPSVVASEQRFWPSLRVETRVTTLPAASGDSAYVEQVVRNLLSNAAKYGSDEGPVELAATAEADEIVVTVRDSGPGIADSDAAHVFDLFYRSSTAERRTSGAGIGLFVCRQLVEAMGGRIWVRRRAEGGTEFGFALPVFTEGVAASAVRGTG